MIRLSFTIILFIQVSLISRPRLLRRINVIKAVKVIQTPWSIIPQSLRQTRKKMKTIRTEIISNATLVSKIATMPSSVVKSKKTYGGLD